MCTPLLRLTTHRSCSPTIPTLELKVCQNEGPGIQACVQGLFLPMWRKLWRAETVRVTGLLGVRKQLASLAKGEMVRCSLILRAISNWRCCHPESVLLMLCTVLHPSIRTLCDLHRHLVCQMISYSPSEGCIQSTLIVRTLWHKIFSRCYYASLLKPVLKNTFASILSGDRVHRNMFRSNQAQKEGDG